MNSIPFIVVFILLVLSAIQIFRKKKVKPPSYEQQRDSFPRAGEEVIVNPIRYPSGRKKPIKIPAPEPKSLGQIIQEQIDEEYMRLKQEPIVYKPGTGGEEFKVVAPDTWKPHENSEPFFGVTTPPFEDDKKDEDTGYQTTDKSEGGVD